MDLYKEYIITEKSQLEARNIDILDFVLITGDSYVDHPSFGAALIARHLEKNNFTVGIIAQPDIQDETSFLALGIPKYAFLITSGNLDSMVNHYTASKKIRNNDSYTAGDIHGKRPDRAVIVYANHVRKISKHTPIIIGGIEASLRRFAHYDYWQNKVRHSILSDSGADLLVYGMGERAILAIAQKLGNGIPIKEITDINGTCYMASEPPENALKIPSFKEVSSDKSAYAKAFKVQYEEQDPIRGKPIAQFDEKKYLVQNPPAMPLSRKELDEVYDLPFTYKVHPMYKQHVPAIDEVQFSITSCRGCFGSCSFCALAFHQGRIVQSRSEQSILREVKRLTKLSNFKGYIHDIGGPSANFRNPSCHKQLQEGTCKHRRCLFPTPCKNIELYNNEFIHVLQSAAKVKGVKKVFVRSGIRYDYLLLEPDDYALKELIKHNISGQLKIAPEHICPSVLKRMGKPSREVYDRFTEKYAKLNKELGYNQYIVPYFISSHPGCTIRDAITLAEYMHKHHIHVKQVQDFYPTPGTLSTTMFYTGVDPLTDEKVYVPSSAQQKAEQRALMQYFLPQNREKVVEILHKYHREDLIGNDAHCLVNEIPKSKTGRKSASDFSKSRKNSHEKTHRKNTSAKNSTRNKPRSRKGRRSL